MTWFQSFLLVLAFVPLLALWGFSAWDIIARPDLSGGARVGWFLLVMLLPLFGTLIYLAFKPSYVTPAQRRAEDAARNAYEESLITDELERLSLLHDDGKLNDKEYAVAKADLLSRLSRLPPAPARRPSAVTTTTTTPPSEPPHLTH